MSLAGYLFMEMTSQDLDAAASLDRGNPSAYSREQLAGELARPCGFQFVARQAASGELVGYICGSRVVDEAEIYRIAVAAPHRGRGVGRGLLEHVLGGLTRSQVHRCYLEVRPSNEPARRLYTAAGFVECGRRRNYYTDPLEDALLMTRKI